MDDTWHDRVCSWDLPDHGEDWLMLRHWSMMPKSVKRFSDDIMLYFFDSEPDSDFRLIRPEIIRLWHGFSRLPYCSA
ncbi:hypothetical protein FJ471_20780 [Mesorhizobium sp. B2-7-1]|nr:hypothetical protein FJ471_20780 [Mesorhizobium sp. B2-7-1]